ncbi:XRE family transcriptional regulator [Nitrosomonas sp. Nm34]|uniref:helix-turn-helix domain-containing protein n=1 Tax=Nitrosomonas sp. Nm34 TaxID=1881055 RepID=UPI0008F1AFF9|nr:XRE family transcriptional regulator [Nitrosomonas sp. Nm34]SFI30961.1 Helix-turn-helix [Nitrosomonas sp. Nm34]
MNNDPMSKIGNKIRQRRVALGMGLQDVCDRIEELGGSMHHSNLSRIESGKQRPREKTLNLILQALQCTLEELFMLTASGGGLSKATIGTRKLSLINDKQVTDYITSNNFESDKFVFTERNLSLKAFALDITDESMTPEFNKGDAVIVDPEVKPEPGDFVVASVGKESYFRKYKMREIITNGEPAFDLSPLNDAFPTISSDLTQGAKIIGTVVEHRIFLKRATKS